MNKSPDFYIAKEMPLNTRIKIIAITAVLGIILQIVISPIAGAVFILGASILGMLKSKSNVPRITANREWKSVTINEFNALLSMLRESTDVKTVSGIFALNSGKGCSMFILMAIAVVVVTQLLKNSGPDFVGYVSLTLPLLHGGSIVGVFIVDALILLLPLWLSGIVNSWEPSEMRVKINQLLPLYESMSTDKTLTFQPNLQVAKSANGSVPLDVKMMVKLYGAPDDFYGIQIQTTMNTVQSAQYPYTYCVLIAKPSFGLINRLQPQCTVEDPGILGGFFASLKDDKNTLKEAKIPRFHDMLVEMKKEGDVEIAVIRQGTGGTQGYTTTPEATTTIFNTALDLARQAMM